MSRTLLLGAVAVSCIGLVLAPGCEQGGADGRQAVSGTVTFEGAPLDQGSIEFTSTGEGPAVFTGAMIENGKYSVPADQGLPPGTYLVKISSAAEDPSAPAPEMPGMPEEGAEGAQERIPAEYNTESTQEVTVTADGENKFDFNIQ